jgi:diguanylate cyclase (GGDEF)-like protein
MSRKVKVCVCDDEPALAEVLCEGLRYHNFDTVEVHSGEEALEVCKNDDIDLILLDVMMTGIDGYTVCERLKANPDTKDIVVIFVTGKDDPQDHEKGFALGAVDYITKPFNLPMVMVRVQAAMRMRNIIEPDLLDTDGLIDTRYTDPLTGLRNQRYLMERLQEEIERAHRYEFPVSCVILDLDNVQPVDAETGAASIDDLLVEAAMSIRSFTRSFEVLARYDGTLFAAVLPHTDLKHALEYGRKIVDDIEATTFSDPNFPTKTTMSVGAVSFQNGNIESAEDVFGIAMKTLLKAKSQPKDNRIAGVDLEQ